MKSIFNKIFPSKWTKTILPEIHGQEGHVNVTIWNLECERHPSGRHRLLDDWGPQFVEWLTHQCHPLHPLQLVAYSPHEMDVVLPSHRPCKIKIEIREFEKTEQLFSDILHSIIAGLAASKSSYSTCPQ